MEQLDFSQLGEACTALWRAWGMDEKVRQMTEPRGDTITYQLLDGAIQ